MTEGARTMGTVTCTECGRVFDIIGGDDAGELYAGHDCEAPAVDDPTDDDAYLYGGASYRYPY
jgi:hypothetical protein